MNNQPRQYMHLLPSLTGSKNHITHNPFLFSALILLLRLFNHHFIIVLSRFTPVYYNSLLSIIMIPIKSKYARCWLRSERSPPITRHNANAMKSQPRTQYINTTPIINLSGRKKEKKHSTFPVLPVPAVLPLNNHQQVTYTLLGLKPKRIAHSLGLKLKSIAHSLFVTLLLSLYNIWSFPKLASSPILSRSRFFFF